MTLKTTLSLRKSADATSPPAALLARLIPEDRDRYVRWWRGFRRLENIAWVGWAGLALGYLSLSFLAFADPRWKLIFDVVFGCGFLLVFGATLWIWVLYCPCCGAMLLHRRFPQVLNLFPPLWFQLCEKCGLKRRQLSDLARPG